MINNSKLIDKREELKKQIALGNYSTVPDVILTSIGQLLKIITRRKKLPNYWYSSLILNLIVFLVGMLLSYVMNESVLSQGPIIQMVFLAVLAGFISMVVAKIFVDKIFKEFRIHIVDSIESVDDIANLQSWTAAVCNTKYQFVCGLLYGILIPIFILYILSNSALEFMGIGPILPIIFSFFQAGLLSYYILLYFVLPGRLSGYDYKLYLNDPSQSKVVEHISNIFTYGLFLFSVVMVITTFSVSFMWDF